MLHIYILVSLKYNLCNIDKKKFIKRKLKEWQLNKIFSFTVSHKLLYCKLNELYFRFILCIRI